MIPSCGFDFGCQINLWLAGVGQHLFGWLPDWVWAVLPYWPWLLALIVAGVVWRFAGWPGLIALAGVVGFVLGRRSTRVETMKPDPVHPVVPPKPVKRLGGDGSIFDLRPKK